MLPACRIRAASRVFVPFCVADVSRETSSVAAGVAVRPSQFEEFDHGPAMFHVKPPGPPTLPPAPVRSNRSGRDLRGSWWWPDQFDVVRGTGLPRGVRWVHPDPRGLLPTPLLSGSGQVAASGHGGGGLTSSMEGGERGSVAWGGDRRCFTWNIRGQSWRYPPARRVLPLSFDFVRPCPRAHERSGDVPR
jgi:hypothetical protein